MPIKPVVVMLALAVCGSSVAAQTLQEKQDRAKQEKSIASAVKEMNTVCKSKIELKFDWTTWKEVQDLAGHHAYSACADGIDPIKTMCRDALAQEAISKQLTKIVCLGNANERTASYKGGTLTIHTGLGVDKGDIHGATRKALGDGLK